MDAVSVSPLNHAEGYASLSTPALKLRWLCEALGMDNAVLAPRRTRSGSQTRQRLHSAGMACTPAERAQLDAAAERAGMSVSAFMRHQCLGTPGPRAVRRPSVERGALAQMLGQLGKCGSNLNQIARVLNSGGEPQGDIAEALLEIRQAALAISRELRGEKA